MRRTALQVAGAVLLLAGAALAALGVWRIADQGAAVPSPTIEAIVTDKQPVGGAGPGGSTGYGVRYHFELNGTEYRSGDARGHPDVLAAVTQEQFDAVRIGGGITVVYDRGAPARNRPAPVPTGIGDGVAAAAAGLLALGCGALTLLAARRTPQGTRPS